MEMRLTQTSRKNVTKETSRKNMNDKKCGMITA